jgi:hypothetical protein
MSTRPHVGTRAWDSSLIYLEGMGARLPATAETL